MVVAGRDETRATAIAAEFDEHVSGIAFDLQETDSYGCVLQDVDQVVMCVDQSGTEFVEACLERGIDYVDITASDESPTGSNDRCWRSTASARVFNFCQLVTDATTVMPRFRTAIRCLARNLPRSCRLEVPGAICLSRRARYYIGSGRRLLR